MGPELPKNISDFILDQSKINFSAFPTLSILYSPKVHMISNIYMSATDTLQPNPIDMVFYGSDMGLQTNPKRGGTGPNFKRSKKISIRNGFNSDFQNPFRIFLFRWSLDFDFLEMIITISLQTIEWSRDLTVAINHIWYHKDTAIINFW